MKMARSSRAVTASSGSCNLNMLCPLSTLRRPRPEPDPRLLQNRIPVNNLTSLEKLMKPNLSYGLMLAIALAGCGHLDEQTKPAAAAPQAQTTPAESAAESLELERPDP